MAHTERRFPAHLDVSDESRRGGMSAILRAVDRRSNRTVALKLLNLGPDQARARESFMREAEALTQLSHANVVELIEFEHLDNGQLCLVLEWVEKNLEEWINDNGPLDWDTYYAEICRPLLQALVFMQQRNWVHRDLKPQNILMTDNGVPKLADYGIAKNISNPLRAGTLGFFGTAPYTAPEPDNDPRYSLSRDCFSMAAVSIFALAGRSLSNYGELTDELGRMPASVPVEILERALSHNPSERPPTASSLLAELDAFQERQERLVTLRRQIKIFLYFPANVIHKLLTTLEMSDFNDLFHLLKEDLEEAFAVEELDETHRRYGSSENAVELRLFGSRWALNVGWSGLGVPRLQVYSAYQMNSVDLGRLREAAHRPCVEIICETPADIEAAKRELMELKIGLAEHDMQTRFAAAEAKRDRVFRMWYAFLKEKAEFEAKRQDPIRFVGRRQQGGDYILSLELPCDPTIIGQERMIRVATGVYIFCEILDVRGYDLTIRITGGEEKRLPQRGTIVVDTRAAEKALDRQRSALDALNYGRAVAPRLKDLLADPSSARLPEPESGIIVSKADFDDEKQEILRKALGMRDIMAVQGPPGTGKTRLIAELVAQFIKKNPKSRILLASQTHIALDHVIGRLLEGGPVCDIIRVGKLDDPKVAAHSQPLLLDRKAEAWLNRVRERAEAHMTEWAKARGLSREHIEIGMLAERLVRVLKQIEEAAQEETVARVEDEEVQQRLDAALEEGTSPAAELDRQAGETQRVRSAAEQQITRLRLDEKLIRERLAEKGEYGAELAGCNRAELGEWTAALISDQPTAQQCKQLLEILEDWVLRVGRSQEFQSAILSGSNVIAGTCIGVASVRGLSEVAFDLCIIDEASKATATEVLVPMVRAYKWLLVGDPKQLPPFIEQGVEHNFSDFSEAEVRETILERLLLRLPKEAVAVLRNQYRMASAIGDMISECFYADVGGLNSVTKAPKVKLTGTVRKPVTWLDTSELPDRSHDPVGSSIQNACEAKIIKQYLELINFTAKRRSQTYEVAVIAGYSAQVALIDTILRDRYSEWRNIRVECNTVDAFQGREAEICIYSATRSHPNLKLGFLKEPPRLNVALSRGRSALLIVGDAEFFRRAKGINPFVSVLNYISAHPETCEVRAADEP